MTKTKFLKGECTQCGGHIEYPAESIGVTVDCPHCSKPTELQLLARDEAPGIPRTAIIWTVAAVVILVLGLGGALAALKRARNWAERQRQTQAAPSTPSPAPAEVTATPAPTPDLSATPPQPADNPQAPSGLLASAIEMEKTKGSSLVYAVGVLTNASDRQRFGVKLELELLDSTGKRLGTARDYQQVIEPKSTWRFKALVVDSKAATAKIASIKEDQ
jgi:hypothetical protein